MRPVVAAPLVGPGARGDLADPRGAAELAHGDDQGLFEQAALVQVGEKGREAAVEHGQERPFQQREVLAVGVPGLVVAGAGADRDHPHAGLDQAARQQQALAQVGQAAELASLLFARVVGVEPVPLADGGRLAREVERPPGCRRRDQRIRLAVMGVEPGRPPRRRRGRDRGHSSSVAGGSTRSSGSSLGSSSPGTL